MNIYFVSTADEPCIGCFVVAKTRGKAKCLGANEMTTYYRWGAEEFLQMRTKLARKNVPETEERVLDYMDDDVLAKYGLRYATEEEYEAMGF